MDTLKKAQIITIPLELLNAQYSAPFKISIL